MRRLLLLTSLSLVVALVFTPAAVAQDLYDCADFATQAEAQGFLLAGDPYGLDADNDGIACEELPGGSAMTATSTATATATATASPTATATASPTATATATVSPTATATASPTATATASPTASATALAGTGGPISVSGLSLIAAVLLLGSGVVSLALLRRSI